MLRIVLVGLSAMLALLGGCLFLGDSASAQPAVKRIFDERYFYDGSPMKKAHETSSCHFCHGGGERKERTAYGRALDRLLEREDLRHYKPMTKHAQPELYQRIDEKVRQAFDTIEKQPSDPKDKNSPTFGELLRDGKLPKWPAPLPPRRAP